mgnify:CR=1 FL=1
MYKRQDLQDIEEQEVGVISQYLPKQISEEDTKKICEEVIKSTGANSIKDMGKVMGQLKKNNADNIDFSKAGAIIKGPVFIDKNSIVKSGTKLNGNIIIGPKCKVGGEISSTIFHGFSNKVHDGFIGNCYIGEWVNLGANTNNSNLKNNYSKVKFVFSDKVIETNKLFLGAMIGDYTRTGISTMINTGSYFGLGTNIFGSGFQNKYISSFAWGKDEVVDFNKFISTIKIIKDRRKEKLFPRKPNTVKWDIDKEA